MSAAVKTMLDLCRYCRHPVEFHWFNGGRLTCDGCPPGVKCTVKEK